MASLHVHKRRAASNATGTIDATPHTCRARKVSRLNNNEPKARGLTCLDSNKEPNHHVLCPAGKGIWRPPTPISDVEPPLSLPCNQCSGHQCYSKHSLTGTFDAHRLDDYLAPHIDQPVRHAFAHRSASSPGALPFSRELSFSKGFLSTVRHRPEYARPSAIETAQITTQQAPTAVDASLIFPRLEILTPEKQQHEGTKDFQSLDDTIEKPSVSQLEPCHPASPSVLTVEKVSTTKVFFETHYDSPNFNVMISRTNRWLSMESSLLTTGPSCIQQNEIRSRFFRGETEHLRKMRALKTLQACEVSGIIRAGYEPLRVLGKGSFGTVRLVREILPSEFGTVNRFRQGEVYATKVIRKSEMLRSGQEGHLRAERDFLVSCAESSKWVVPLIASFQDADFLYLVMEYEIGGDFLGYLLRKETLSEPVTQWYIAEMVLCVEEAHRLRWIHRDIKPDNFLISTSGHLKISDFGLAFDCHWSHQQAYYTDHRTSLLKVLGIEVAGDAEDREIARVRPYNRLPKPCSLGPNEAMPHSRMRNDELRATRRRLARSVVGTSQYMAPEVVRGQWYDARCDWWSIGIVMYECLYGFTPFCREDRDTTKAAILRHSRLLYFPESAESQRISQYAQDLIWRLLQEPAARLGAGKYLDNDYALCDGYVVPKDKNSATYVGKHVYQNDAEDIKHHPFFLGFDWSGVLQSRPPFVPKYRSEDSTKYFDSEEQIMGLAAACKDDENEWIPVAKNDNHKDGAHSNPCIRAAGIDGTEQAPTATRNDLGQANNGTAVHVPIRHVRRKRPRDKLLRDPQTAPIVLEERKRCAFLGYEYHRPATWNLGTEVTAAFAGNRASIEGESETEQIQELFGRERVYMGYGDKRGQRRSSTGL